MDEETWLSAQEAYEYGLCDVIEPANQMVASISEKLFETYQKVPNELLKPVQKNELSEEQRKQIIQQAKQDKAFIGDILGGL